jgi:polysaccharide export outer membrane protein
MAAKQIVRLGFVAAFVVGCVALGNAQQTNPKISPRDQVVIEVLGIESMKGKFRVDVDGTISFPPLEKPIKVAGLTVREVEQLLSKQLLDEGWLTVLAKISAVLEQIPNKRILVNGEVRTPGAITFAGELSVLEAVLQAGSTTPEAGDLVLIIRAPRDAAGVLSPPEDSKEGSNIIEVSLRELQSGLRSEKNLALLDGDRVYVRKAEQVYIDGYVSRPGAYSVTAGMTLKQVITRAGGVVERGSRDRIEVQRGDTKLKNVKYDKTTVMPGDTITVKSRIF